jgi:hypothetical protein
MLWLSQLKEGMGMGSGRLVWWRREVLGLAGRVGGPGRGLRRRGLVRRLRVVAVLAGVPLLSLGLVAGVSVVAGGALHALKPASHRRPAAFRLR